jgi:2Fe-2S ferredoxin
MSKTITINVIDRDGVESALDWQAGDSLMETLRDNDYPILASCGGNASCATCHVFLPKEQVDRLGQRSDDELELLEETESYDAECSRLSCQVQADDGLEQVTVRIAPED